MNSVTLIDSSFHLKIYKSFCKVINWPNFNIIASTGIGKHEDKKEREGVGLVGGTVRTHTFMIQFSIYIGTVHGNYNCIKDYWSQLKYSSNDKV